MRNGIKKLLGFVATATMIASTLATSACGEYKLDQALTLPTTTAEVTSNGGFAVEKGGYVYFINGMENYTVNNEYGQVAKGALMRVKKSDLADGKFDQTEMVIPTLVGSQNFNAGIFIYGDYVYYATPTTGKNLQGVVENSWIDFKRAKLDGTEVMSDYYFRLASNTANYRFVEVNNTVYCLYEDGGALKSFNTADRKTTVLVKGAEGFYFDMKDLTNPTVYYSMGVNYHVDSEKTTQATYNQIYSVKADATATVDSSKASYTVANGRTYDFDEAYLKKVNEDAKKKAEKDGPDYTPTYDLNDYSTYPYVNLGTLVVDGVGAKCDVNVAEAGAKVPYNNSTETNAELQGYKYTLARYENGGVYYTRSDGEKLYYYNPAKDATVTAVGANKAAEVVALNTTSASASALFSVNNGVHQYVYISGNDIYRATAAADGTVAEEVRLTNTATSKTLWKTEGDYLYYYGSGTMGSGAATSGAQLSRINYVGDADKYDAILNHNEGAEYRPVSLNYVDFNTTWYKPETFDGIMLYANAEAIGGTSFNYVFATKLGTAEEIKANNDLYEKAYNYMDENFTTDKRNAATYLFRTYKRGVEDNKQWFFEDFADVQVKYKEKNNKEISWAEDFLKETDGVIALFKNKTYIVESDLINMVGSTYSEANEKEIRSEWKELLPYPVVTVTEESMPWWGILLIVVGATLVVGGGVTALLIVLHQKKVKKAEADATVNAYKRKKIDTTDDKSIDVYAMNNEENK